MNVNTNRLLNINFEMRSNADVELKSEKLKIINENYYSPLSFSFDRTCR